MNSFWKRANGDRQFVETHILAEQRKDTIQQLAFITKQCLSYYFSNNSKPINSTTLHMAPSPLLVQQQLNGIDNSEQLQLIQVNLVNGLCDLLESLLCHKLKNNQTIWNLVLLIFSPNLLNKINNNNDTADNNINNDNNENNPQINISSSTSNSPIISTTSPNLTRSSSLNFSIFSDIATKIKTSASNITIIRSSGINDGFDWESQFDYIFSLSEVSTDHGRFRAFLRRSLNEKFLVQFLNSFTTNNDILKNYYEEDAMLRNREDSDVFRSMLASLDPITFDIDYNDPLLNNLEIPDTPLSIRNIDNSFISIETSSNGTNSNGSSLNNSLTNSGDTYNNNNGISQLVESNSSNDLTLSNDSQQTSNSNTPVIRKKKTVKSLTRTIDLGEAPVLNEDNSINNSLNGNNGNSVGTEKVIKKKIVKRIIKTKVNTSSSSSSSSSSLNSDTVINNIDNSSNNNIDNKNDNNSNISLTKSNYHVPTKNEIDNIESTQTINNQDESNQDELIEKLDISSVIETEIQNESIQNQFNQKEVIEILNNEKKEELVENLIENQFFEHEGVKKVEEKEVKEKQVEEEKEKDEEIEIQKEKKEEIIQNIGFSIDYASLLRQYSTENNINDQEITNIANVINIKVGQSIDQVEPVKEIKQEEDIINEKNSIQIQDSIKEDIINNQINYQNNIKENQNNEDNSEFVYENNKINQISIQLREDQDQLELNQFEQYIEPFPNDEVINDTELYNNNYKKLTFSITPNSISSSPPLPISNSISSSPTTTILNSESPKLLTISRENSFTINNINNIINFNNNNIISPSSSPSSSSSSISSVTSISSNSSLTCKIKTIKSPNERLNQHKTNLLNTNITMIDNYSNEKEVIKRKVEEQSNKQFKKDINKPRKRLHFKIQTEFSLKDQDFKCAGCNADISSIFKSSRLCDYSGKYFCGYCHDKSVYYIPSRIITNWDFKKYPIAKANLQFLKEIEHDPLIDISSLNPNLYIINSTLLRIRNLRKQMFHLKDFLGTCGNGGFKLLKTVTSNEGFNYFVKDIDLFSLQDLINHKALLDQIRIIVAKWLDHCESCQYCLSKGSICQVCNIENKIYPYHIGTITQCNTCKSFYHKSCYSPIKCPICLKSAKLRIQQSNSTQIK